MPPQPIRKIDRGTVESTIYKQPAEEYFKIKEKLIALVENIRSVKSRYTDIQKIGNIEKSGYTYANVG